jgi:hypothetical protein
MRFGSLASMIGGCGMQENISLFESTFDRTLESEGWQQEPRIIGTVQRGLGLCSTMHLSG